MNSFIVRLEVATSRIVIIYYIRDAFKNLVKTRIFKEQPFIDSNKAIIMSKIAIPNESGSNLGPMTGTSPLVEMGLFPASTLIHDNNMRKLLFPKFSYVTLSNPIENDPLREDL